MPQLGEIRRGKEIGHAGGSTQYIWQGCSECGEERWVQLKRNKPVSLKCTGCAPKRGSASASWKGGKIKNKRGYILILLQPDDFFYPMVNKSGYVSEHRLVVAKRLGRNLQPWELVHHKDHIRDHNDDNNLQLVSDDRHKQITILENRITRLEERVEDQTKLIRLLQWQIKEYNKEAQWTK